MAVTATTEPVVLLERAVAAGPIAAVGVAPADAERLWSALEDVVDPCSAAQGTPLSLAAMGLLRSCAVLDGCAEVTIAVTGPGCTFVGHLADAVARTAADLPGITSVRVLLDIDLVWHEGLLRTDARSELAASRAAGRPSRSHLALVPTAPVAR